MEEKSRGRSLCQPEYFDNEAFDFLGYKFDPGNPEISISESGHQRIAALLVEAERIQEQAFIRRRNEYRSKSPGGRTIPFNPLLGQPPAYLWRALRDVRSGYSKVPASSPEWGYYLEGSRWLAEWSASSEIIRLHDKQFAEKGTPDYLQFRSLLRSGDKQEVRP